MYITIRSAGFGHQHTDNIRTIQSCSLLGFFIILINYKLCLSESRVGFPRPLIHLIHSVDGV